MSSQAAKAMHKKYPATVNIGIIPITTIDGGDWVRACDLEEVISKAIPVFSRLDPDFKQFLNWSQAPDIEPDVLGFVIGPFDVPMAVRLGMAPPKEEKPLVFVPEPKQLILPGMEGFNG